MSGPFEMRLHDVDDDTEPAPRGPGTRRSDRRDVVTEPIDCRLGHLRVDAHGALTDVCLNEHAVRAMRPDRVAGYLVTAINRAQAHDHTRGRRS